jgi:hypothetical protein
VRGFFYFRSLVWSLHFAISNQPFAIRDVQGAIRHLRAHMTTSKLFWNITLRATLGGVVTALVTQAIFAVSMASVGIVAAVMNQGERPFTAAEGLPILLGILFLGLVGAVAGGIIAIPIGVVLGVSGGVVMSAITRLLFYPLQNARRYRAVVGVSMAGYSIIVCWLVLMAVYLLFARNNTIQSPLVPWLALIPALIAGVLGYIVSGKIAQWYERSELSGAKHVDRNAQSVRPA